jgi:hypothetical protein
VHSQLFIPFRLKGISNETIGRIDLHITLAGELGLIARALEMLPVQGIGLGGTRLELALHCERDLQRHGRHQLHEQSTNRRIDDLARN